jgi:hypothetical protein
LLLACLGFVALGLQREHLHAGQRLAGADEVALIDEDGIDPAAQLGGHVDLGGFDAAVAAGQSLAGPL